MGEPRREAHHITYPQGSMFIHNPTCLQKKWTALWTRCGEKTNDPLDGVVATCMERIATENAPYGLHPSAQEAVAGDRLVAVLGTGGVEATVAVGEEAAQWAMVEGEGFLIEADEG